MTKYKARRLQGGWHRHLLAGLSLGLALILSPLEPEAQTMSPSTIEQKLQALEDGAALKTLVDTFSNLADTKDVTAQLLLFTEDATVSSVSSGQPGSSFKGRKEIGDAFAGYLANFETVYHINGQQTVELNGDTATGTAYCLVVLIADEAGKKIKNTSGVTYHDEYVRRDGKWLIAKRTSNFAWRDRQELGQ
ncbi:nuclear transport factor 2 family protein [Rhizobium sp. PEPV16]|uniref:nuclear transport factor 2 family protein n=3 Tax=Rhizobium TaxID=379 RepID=UPI001AEF48D5|nr:nuclear transport factor 2 family protein [Rhizobium sp. PEPV16]